MKITLEDIRKEIHKALGPSSAIKNTKPNTRETKCGTVVKDIEASKLWKNVTCELCLRNK